MKYLSLGLDAPVAKRFWVMVSICLSCFLFQPMIYAATIYYAYFNAWDLTSTKELKLKAQKTFLVSIGLIYGILAAIIVMPNEFKIMLENQELNKILLQLFIVYQTSIFLFIFIHHFGFHQKQEKS